MYHRIAAPEADIWDIAVSPAHFEGHLQVLQSLGCMVPLQELVENVQRGTLKKNSIALTFDDGYLDNFLTAKPLLEQYGIPATFFVSTGNLGSAKEFWWDELEYLLLFAQTLPAQFTQAIAGETISAALPGETHLTEALRQQHTTWNACLAPPPSQRARLFFQVWQALKPLPVTEQERHLQKIREWAGVSAPVSRADFVSMSVPQLKELAAHRLFTIGAHTVHHAALACHAQAFQEQEIAQNRHQLQVLTGQPVDLLAYPYGNYNAETLQVAEKLNFRAAFTTEEQVVTKGAHPYRMGRLQVPDWSPAVFAREIKKAWALVKS